jgi:hypothetical protein
LLDSGILVREIFLWEVRADYKATHFRIGLVKVNSQKGI